MPSFSASSLLFSDSDWIFGLLLFVSLRFAMPCYAAASRTISQYRSLNLPSHSIRNRCVRVLLLPFEDFNENWAKLNKIAYLEVCVCVCYFFYVSQCYASVWLICKYVCTAVTIWSTAIFLFSYDLHYSSCANGVAIPRAYMWACVCVFTIFLVFFSSNTTYHIRLFAIENHRNLQLNNFCCCLFSLLFSTFYFFIVRF